MRGEALPSEGSLIQPVRLDHRAHRSIENQDPAREQVAELR